MIRNQLRVISDDIFNGHFIGYHQILDRFANTHTNSYPPHNVIKTGEDTYDIEFAVAGFSPEEISVTIENSVMTVSAEQSEPNDKEYVHCGITTRGFSKQFPLNEYWEIEKAESANGILTISVKQEIPEAKKPKIIKIRYKS